MSLAPGDLCPAAAIGIGATLVMDLWNLFLKRVFGLPSLNYCLLGRWLRHMPAGTIRHASISAAPAKALECQVGWVAHYSIGVVFAIGFVALVSGDWLARPRVLPAVLYGLATVVFPFFIMQPSLGSASRRPRRRIRCRPGSRASRRIRSSGWGCMCVRWLEGPLLA